MATFVGAGPTSILHFYSQFVEKCNSEKILETHACLVVPCVLMEKVTDHFLAEKDASSYIGLHYWPKYVNYFLPAYPTTMATRNKVMPVKDLKQLLRKTEVEFSLRVHEIAYRCDKAYLLEAKMSNLIFGLQSTIQTIIAHETKEHDDRRRSFQDVIQKARKESKANCACLTRPTVHRKAFFASSRLDQDSEEHASMMYGKWSNHAYHGPQKPVGPPPRTPDPIENHRRDRPG